MTERLPAARRGERVGCYFYDWANSAFATTVVTVFIGPYLTTVSKAASDPDGFVWVARPGRRGPSPCDVWRRVVSIRRRGAPST